MVQEIQLKDGIVAYIDEIDADLQQQRWYAAGRKNAPGTYNIQRRVYLLPGASTVLLARVILSRMLGRDLCKGEQVDHVDLNTLNNTRDNLRLASHGQNQANKRLLSNNTSGYKGAYFNKRTQKWTAVIKINGRQQYLGSFDTPKEAHEAYKQAAQVHYGEFARFE